MLLLWAPGLSTKGRLSERGSPGPVCPEDLWQSDTNGVITLIAETTQYSEEHIVDKNNDNDNEDDIDEDDEVTDVDEATGDVTMIVESGVAAATG